MAPRRIRVERLITVLGVAVLVLGGLLLWLATRAGGLGGGAPSPEERARAQLRELVGPQAVVRYTEPGRRGAICGYVGTGEVGTIAFISRANRLILETDPLKAEFDEMQRDLCPGFLKPLPGVE